MPSANAKPEKVATQDSSDPLRQAIVIVEHKIRNLEKRKSKLDSYKEAKTKSKEQLEAISKYEEVLQQLELSREYVKQFTSICVENDKLRKRAAKKEALEKTTGETAKIKQVLLIQDILQNMGTEQAREDFLAGQNGAVQLVEADLKCLDDLYGELTLKHDGPTPFTTQLQKAAEALMTIVDGRTREVAGTTGNKFQALVKTIVGCGYFDQQEQQQQVEATEPEEEVPAEQELEGEGMETPPEEEVVPESQEEAAPLASSIPPSAPIHQILQNIVPVSQVESNMFSAQGFQPPNATGAAPLPPTVVPLSDVMSRVGGAFTFFQESELEGAEQQHSSSQPTSGQAIPSRTFTNQTYNGQTPQPNMPPMPYANPTPNNYYPAGYQQADSTNYAHEVQVPAAYPVTTNDTQNTISDTAKLVFSQPSQHVSNSYPQPTNVQLPNNAVPPNAAAQVAPPVANTYQMPSQPEEKPSEPPQTDWAASDRLNWDNEEISEWNPQGTESKSSGAPRNRDRGDRPRNSFRNRNSNYSNNNRSDRDRDSGNNNGNYYNNQNGYRGDRGEYRGDRGDYRGDRNDRGGYRGDRNDRGDYRGDRNDRGDYRGDRNDRGDYRAEKSDVNGGGYNNGYRRGGPPRGPRPERSDQNGTAPRNNAGPRPPRNRPPRQDRTSQAQDTK